ncbi:Ferric enterobactin transport ATP-binding protein FepC [Pontiella desulfatans]|uniref:Ferric enterobactin transport ATP-binding protein FepC n=1 Tax=Pontiella desulfatans TaxID=2750659 RepID=A0A6C2U4K4_PONDE|nr:ABC transporter ATP-binding protein [Pontiella desulfatans]VGO14910.1 Ferric enterobactin transport ATP-binding protein FepC [Pontiella desulfatans]
MSEPIIQIKNLSISLSGNEILKGVSLDIGEGVYVSIIGPNGAGKTTLVKCMAGIYREWSGSIGIGGKAFGDLGNRELARLQSYVPQAEGRTNPLTVEEFVATGRYPHLSAFTTMQKDDYEAVDKALDRAGLLPLRKRNLNTLSGGERQMAFIAAALAQDTQILLLDEPSTFLDYRHQAKVASILKSACREHGITVVAVHHDINTATSCSNQIVALKDGTIAFEGTPAETANAEVLQNIYCTEFVVAPSPHRPLPYIMSGGAI